MTTIERQPRSTTHIIFGNGTPHKPDFPGVDPKEWVFNHATQTYEPKHPAQNGFHPNGVNVTGANTEPLTSSRI